MNISPIFCSFVAEDNLDLDNSKIENYCHNLKKSDSGRLISNIGGWQSNILKNVDLDLRELYEALMPRLDAMNAKLGYEGLKPDIQGFWFNINGKNNYNEVHDHPMSFYAAVYYVKASKGQGDIVFCHPINFISNYLTNNKLKESNQFNSATWKFTPKTGMLLIFPSYLSHLVRKNETEEERISVAFNIGMREI